MDKRCMIKIQLNMNKIVANIDLSMTTTTNFGAKSVIFISLL